MERVAHASHGYWIYLATIFASDPFHGLLVQECVDLDIEVRPFVPVLPNRLFFVQPLGPKASEGAVAFVKFATARLQMMTNEPMIKHAAQAITRDN
ncbi:hypothetical protein [Falsirhodobacter sp. 1013]|uniref:hypothetical protein n=1 Tax=Falsirhodobacter sp. 1013 TaxID=3417566 RepID=UPI003EB9AECF